MSQYYDEQRDQADKQKYYEGIDPENDLATQLSVLLNATHKNHLPYKPSLYVYPKADRQESGKLAGIYSNTEYELEEILMKDAAIDAERQQIIQFKATEELGRSLSFEEAMEIEMQKPYNCEHVVPQGWFGHSLPMLGDLHHLFTSEERCNSLRGSKKYFDSPNTVIEPCGIIKPTEFEPAQNKPVLARAVLYFLLRYPGIIDEYNEHDIDMLKQWHETAAPSLYEKHRNQCIFDMQGNRNPLIDHPEWAAKLTFTVLTKNAEFFSHNDDSPTFTESDPAPGCTDNPPPWDNEPWRVALCLKTLRNQVNELAPNRKKQSDGTIGDVAHQNRSSDHNPHILDQQSGQGVVTAMDITHDPNGGCDCNILASSLQNAKDARVKYVIWNRRIMNSSPIGNTAAWEWRPYGGSNPHNKHIHISVKCDKATYDSQEQWTIDV